MPEAPGEPEEERYDAPERLEEGRLLFARPPKFMLSVAKLEQLPDAGPPEIAVAGRSNVGKSSLINALTGHGHLARTSNTPGRTQQLNFFELDGGRLWLVDLPGYGYAQAPKKLVDEWTRLIFAYLQGRQSLRAVALLIDARVGVKANDAQAMELLAKAAVPFLPVLTKTDSVKPSELVKRADEVRTRLAKQAAALPDPAMTSSKKGTGLEVLRARLAGFAGEEKRPWPG